MSIKSISNKQVVLPVTFAKDIISGLVGESQALKLGRRLSNMRGKTHKLNVLKTIPIASWTNQQSSPTYAGEPDIKNKPLSHLAWEGKDVVAEEVSVIIPYSINTLADIQDYGTELLPEIREQVIGAFQDTIDATVFFGVNSPWSGFSGVVAEATIANATVSWDGSGGQSFYNAVSNAMKLVEESGYIPTGILGGPTLDSAFRQTITDLGILAGEQGGVGALPRHINRTGGFNQSSAFAIIGDFRYLLYAFREEMDMTILTESTLVDPATGSPMYYLGQQGMIALRFALRLGVALPNPVNRISGVASGNVLKAGSRAYPFSIITKSVGGNSE